MRRQDVELLEIGRAVRPPMDVVVIFQIYASARKGLDSDIVRPEVRIPGRIHRPALRPGRGEAFEAGGFELPPLPRSCDRECLLERVGDESKILGTPTLARRAGREAEGYIKTDPAPAAG